MEEITRREREVDKRKEIPCRYFKEQKCSKINCPYKHDKTIKQCKFFKMGTCKFNDQCKFKHIRDTGETNNKAPFWNMEEYIKKMNNQIKMIASYIPQMYLQHPQVMYQQQHPRVMHHQNPQVMHQQRVPQQ